MKSKIKALVLTGYGLNCDRETAYAFESAGASADRVHINALIDKSFDIADYGILAFIGGFGWGDDHGAGVIQALRLKIHSGDRIAEFIEKGNLVIGICNGFQVLVNMGLLPGPDGARRVALTENDTGIFRDDWVTLRVNPQSPCVFMKGISRIDLPIRHGEGKFHADGETIDRLRENGQVVLQYAMPDGRAADGRFPHNPNGSMEDIAGICDPTGRVFGLMPHPEAFHHPLQHPAGFRKKEKAKRSRNHDETRFGDGIGIFRNAVEYFSA